MRTSSQLLWLSGPLLLVVLSSHAQGPNDHAEHAQEPCCAEMQGMDHSGTDMHRKCYEEMHGKRSDYESAGAAHADHREDAEQKMDAAANKELEQPEPQDQHASHHPDM